MSLKFWYDVGEKPLGNWRPAITFGYSWDKRDIEHNPDLKSIYLVAKGLMAANKAVTISNFAKAVGIEDVYMVYLELPSNGEPWCLWSKDTKGFPSTFIRDVSTSEKFVYSYLRVLDASAVDPRTKYSRELKFYGPWKPGACPDYSDVVPVLKTIGETIAQSLNSGKESGTSLKVSDELIYKDGLWMSRSEYDRYKDIQGKVRKIDIDEEEKEEEPEPEVASEEAEAASGDRFSIKIDEDGEEEK